MRMMLLMVAMMVLLLMMVMVMVMVGVRMMLKMMMAVPHHAVGGSAAAVPSASVSSGLNRGQRRVGSGGSGRPGPGGSPGGTAIRCRPERRRGGSVGVSAVAVPSAAASPADSKTMKRDAPLSTVEVTIRLGSREI